MLSDRSLDNLVGVDPDFTVLFTEVEREFPCEVIDGVRTDDEQQELYAQGRTAPGGIVTNCDGIVKRSKHQDGWAVDVVPLPIDWKDEDVFKAFGWYVKGVADTLYEQGLICNKIKWGGDWKMKDYPHYEI